MKYLKWNTLYNTFQFVSVTRTNSGKIMVNYLEDKMKGHYLDLDLKFDLTCYLEQEFDKGKHTVRFFSIMLNLLTQIAYHFFVQVGTSRNQIQSVKALYKLPGATHSKHEN